MTGPKRYEKHKALTDGHAPYFLTETDLIALQAECEDVIEQTIDTRNYSRDNLTPANFAYCLVEVNRLVFKHRPELTHYYNLSSGDYSGEIILENVEAIYDIYYNVCTMYGQIVSVRAYFRMLGLLDAMAYIWQDGNRPWELSTKKKSKLTKIIKKDREEMLSNVMMGDRSNSVKYIAILNHEYSWDKQTAPQDDGDKRVMSIDALPKLKELELSRNLGLPDLGDSD